MSQKSFIAYIFDKTNTALGTIGILVTVISYIRSHSLYPSLTILLSLISCLLFYSLYHIYTRLNKANNENMNLSKKYNNCVKEFQELSASFKGQTKSYQDNIQELNCHKKITYAVSTLIKAQEITPPKSIEAKKILILLSISVEEALKGGTDKNE